MLTDRNGGVPASTLWYTQRMATNPVDPIEDEAQEAFADPKVRARIEAYVERRREGRPERRHSAEEVLRHFGLSDDAEE